MPVSADLLFRSFANLLIPLNADEETRACNGRPFCPCQSKKVTQNMLAFVNGIKLTSSRYRIA